MTVTDQDIEARLRGWFEENFERLRLEGGHPLRPEVREMAFYQVLLYWRKLRAVAEQVTDTEVLLSLPQQFTPDGRKFAIEGVVDIVRDNDSVVMYDIKTHDASYVRANTSEYAGQLDVYAHIWQTLHQSTVDATYVICTAFPEAIREALRQGDDDRLDYELARWNPLIDIHYDTRHAQAMIQEFGGVVDQIEGGEWAAPPVERLQAALPGGRTLFATYVCRNCDARFSCGPYREWALASRGRAEQTIRHTFFDDVPEAEREEWVLAALEAVPTNDEDLL